MRGKRAAAVCLVALVALSGCTDKSDKSAENGAVASAAPTVEASDPATAFKAAVTKTNQATMTFTIDADLGTLGSQKASGAADPKAKATGYHSDLTLSGQSVTIDAILVGSDLYLKVPGVTSGDRWAHMDMTKVKSLSKLGLDASGNPTNLGTLDAEVVTVTRTAPGAYSGTLDRTKNPVVASAGGVSEALKSVPFEATVNPQGYVTSLVIRTPPVGSGPASTSTSKFADFAQPIAIERPDSAEVQQAPDELYQALQ